jgi:hypothetical protein
VRSGWAERSSLMSGFWDSSSSTNRDSGAAHDGLARQNARVSGDVVFVGSRGFLHMQPLYHTQRPQQTRSCRLARCQSAGLQRIT